MDFHGAKVAILAGDKLLMHLRDNKPGLFNANMWDFPGGGREGNETPQECAIREIKEELGLVLEPRSFIWERAYPAQKDPDQKAFFLVAIIDEKETENIDLQEGQKWALLPQEEFFEREDVVNALKGRFRDYLESRKLQRFL